MSRSRLLRVLFVAASFAVSSQAHAYLLDPYNVVWPFEGRGSGPGIPETEVTGSLRFNAPTVYIQSTPNGTTDLTSGFIGTTTFQNSPAGSGYDGVASGPALQNDGSVSSAPGILHPMDATWGVGKIGLDLRDLDGVAFDDGFLNPSGVFMPPAVAPDISQFESHVITIYQSNCSDSAQLGNCAQGGGNKQFLPVYTIAIDLFVPEPATLGLGALVCLGLAALRGASARRRD